jgi:uncharacterized protein YbbK (DUF523 family)
LRLFCENFKRGIAVPRDAHRISETRTPAARRAVRNEREDDDDADE